MPGALWQAREPTPAVAESENEEEEEEELNYVFAPSEADDDEECALFVSEAEPLTYEEAMRRPDAEEWRKAYCSNGT